MFYFIESCERLNQGRAQRLCFIGFGIRHPRSGREQIIPNLYNATAHYSLVFNHEPVKISIDGAAGGSAWQYAGGLESVRAGRLR